MIIQPIQNIILSVQPMNRCMDTNKHRIMKIVPCVATLSVIVATTTLIPHLQCTQHHHPQYTHHPHHLVTSCNSYKVVKKFVPARFNRYGQLVGGHWKTKRKCAHPTRTLLVSSPYHRHIHSTHIHHHTSVPVVAKEPKVVHQQVATAPVNRCEDKLARMGVGGVLGGLVGRFAVGGSKSSNTVLGTTVGAVAGSLVGAATC